MRKDMFKVIVERPRTGGKAERKGRTKDFEDMPRKEAMKKPHKVKGSYKQLNENLKPLWRFLDGAVGRPWDKVYSEICENLKTTSTVQQHVRDHLKHHVWVDVRVDGKKVTGSRGRRYYELSNGNLYVHPITGILRRYKVPKAKKTEPEDPMVVGMNQLLAGNSKVLLHEGIWYKVYKDKKSGVWNIFHVANAAQARIDAASLRTNIHYVLDNNGVGRYGRHTVSAEAFFRRYEKRIRGSKDVYWVTLIDLLWGMVERYKQGKQAEKRKAELPKRSEEVRLAEMAKNSAFAT